MIKELEGKLETSTRDGSWVCFTGPCGYDFHFRDEKGFDQTAVGLVGEQKMDNGEWVRIGTFDDADDVIGTVFSVITWSAK